MPGSVCPLLAACCALCLPAVAVAATPKRPVVAGFERNGRADARAGRLLLGELGCARCHHSDDEVPAGPKQGPVLDGLAGRVRIGWLRRYLSGPHTVKPGTTMPDVLANDPDKARKVEALVHFLATTGTLKQQRPQIKQISVGRDLYHKVGCVACHGTRKDNGEADLTLSTSVPLGELKAKYTLASLAEFLVEPCRVRPSGRMPRLLDAREATAVANFLLQGLVVDLGGRGASKYAYYEGRWDRLPDFARLTPKATGTAPGFDTGVARRRDNFALKFDGVLDIPQEDTYTFSVGSDDGAQLFIDGKLVVNNDGVHATQFVTAKVKLTKGIHAVTLTFFQGGGDVALEASIEAPGFGRHPLGDLIAVDEAALRKPPLKRSGEDAEFTLQPELARQGKALFGSLGCASCHALNEAGKPIASARTAAPLAKLRAEEGCLKGMPNSAPWFGLDHVQRKALTAALKSAPPARTPLAVVAETLAALNCYACHSRDKVGGPQEEFNRLFQTTQPEMGDEGRVPPPLDGVGAKLAPAYLSQLLDRGGHDRPYMHTRMPGFGTSAAHMVKAFAALDRLPAVGEVKFTQASTAIKHQGRHLVGDGAFACIKCHTFAGKKAEGVQGIDMTLMPKRLQRDWFHAYISDPQKVRPGTRMPSAFTDGKSALPKILDGTARTQIEAMWVYLQDGPRARVPIGVGGVSIPLVPTTTAIIYRNFIEGAGSRGIAVGYPEKAHLAFDANEMRLALLWHGAFLDAGKHWTDRGSGFEGPLGDNILRLPPGVPFAVLTKPDDPWPNRPAREQGYRFRGYRLTADDRPTFLYGMTRDARVDIEGLRVEDFFSPVAAGPDVHMKRTLKVTAENPAGVLTYRAAAGNKIEQLADGWYRIDTWRIRLHAGKPHLRKSAGKMELLVPVPLVAGQGTVVVEYAW